MNAWLERGLRGRTRCVKFEPTGPALGPKSGPAGLLHGLNATCWAHPGLKMNNPMLREYTAGPDAGLQHDCFPGVDAWPVQLGAALVRSWSMTLEKC